MDYTNLTDDEKRDLINHAITRHYSKMLKDERRITSYNYHIYSDLLSFCLEQFLTKKPLEYQFQCAVIDDKILNYMGRSMSLNLKSSSSPYWNQVRKQSYNFRGVYLVETDAKEKLRRVDKEELDHIDETFDLPLHQIDPVECINHAIDNLNFYYKALVNEYFINELTYVAIHKKYGISVANVKKAIEEGKQLIKQQCQHFNL
jgi:hypothetical protein